MLRREDRRFLLGNDQFVADLVLPGMLHAAFVRSPVAHARIRSLDLSRAAAAPGVALVLSGAELARLLPTIPDHQVALPSKWRTTVRHRILNPQQALLAADKVRHVGEAFVVVVADSRYAAEDAAALVEPVRSAPAWSIRARMRPDAPIVHEQFGNLVAELAVAKGDVERARIRAASVATAVSPSPLRCRWNAAAWSAPMMRAHQSLTVWSATQVVHWVRREVAATLNAGHACAASRSTSAAASA
jgi:carbon-monoxide dehydrogenase large subunit